MEVQQNSAPRVHKDNVLSAFVRIFDVLGLCSAFSPEDAIVEEKEGGKDFLVALVRACISKFYSLLGSRTQVKSMGMTSPGFTHQTDLSQLGVKIEFLERLLTVSLNSNVSCLTAFWSQPEETEAQFHSYLFFRILTSSSVNHVLDRLQSLRDGDLVIVAALQHFVKVLSEDYVLPDFFKQNPVSVTKNFARDVRVWVTELVETLKEQQRKINIPVVLKVEIQDLDQKFFEQIRKLI